MEHVITVYLVLGPLTFLLTLWLFDEDPLLEGKISLFKSVTLWPFTLFLVIMPILITYGITYILLRLMPSLSRNIAMAAMKEIVELPEISISRRDLKQRFSTQEIENREYVIDPLGAVPNVPFGHLNRSWKAFLDSIDPNDELWSFSLYWGTCAGQRIAGYVAVHPVTGAIGPHFLTVVPSNNHIL